MESSDISNDKIEQDKQKIQEKLNEKRKNELIDMLAGWVANALHSKVVKKGVQLKNRVRDWIDSAQPNTLEDVFTTPKDEGKAKKFIAKVMPEVAQSFKDNIQREPKGKVYLPFNFIVFINSTDDKQWSNFEQEILRKILQMHIYDAAIDLAGKAPLASSEDDFKVEFILDGTLKEGEIRVTGSFESSRQDTTYSPDEAERIAARLAAKNSTAKDQNPPETLVQSEKNINRIDVESVDPEKTEYYTGDPEKTTYYDFIKPYNIEVWRNDEYLNTYTFNKKTISIGRNAEKGKFDINLSESYISRPQAWIEVDEQNNYWIKAAKSINPTLKNGIECPKGQKIKINFGETVQFMDFNLRFPGLTRIYENAGKSSSSNPSKPRPPGG